MHADDAKHLCMGMIILFLFKYGYNQGVFIYVLHNYTL